MPLHRLAMLFVMIAVAVLTTTRLASLLLFGGIAQLHANALWLDELFWLGLRFDLKVAATLLCAFIYLPAIVVGWLDRYGWFTAYARCVCTLATALVVLIAFGDIGYRLYFGAPIDVRLFGLVEDDTTAVIKTFVDDPRLVLLTLIGLVFTTAVTAGYWRWTRAAAVRYSWRQLVLSVVAVLMTAIVARGSIGTFPLSKRNSSISNDALLNSLTMNGVMNLYYAFAAHREFAVFGLTTADILAQAGVDDVDELTRLAGFTDDLPLLQTTSAHNGVPPPHVVFVLMEGWSTQIARAHSATNQVLGAFAAHKNADYWYERFVANTPATNHTIERLLLNSPITPISQLAPFQVRFGLSHLLPYKQAGYQTVFLSGGYAAWQNHGAFWSTQGIDRYISRERIEAERGEHADNPWGVYDGWLFDYLRNLLSTADTHPLFAFVLTTNNHPPVKLPPDYRAPPLDLTAYGLDPDDRLKYEMLTGYHYQTNALGEFLSWLKQSEFADNTIVVATGDHPLRAFYDDGGPRYRLLAHAVPLYLYVPPRYAVPQLRSAGKVASHADIFPTIMSLSLPHASYYAFGRSLLDDDRPQFGWSQNGVFVFDDGVVDIRANAFYRNDTDLLLQPTPLPIPDGYARTITAFHYQEWLKKLLLLQDYGYAQSRQRE